MVTFETKATVAYPVSHRAKTKNQYTPLSQPLTHL